MSVQTTTRVLPFERERLFELVADVERYPEFLPFWREAKVRCRGRDRYRTEQQIGVGLFQERFQSETVLKRPTRIEISTQEPPFQELRIRWSFEPAGDAGCVVHYWQKWELRSVLLQGVMDTMGERVVRLTVEAFERRARSLYGEPVRRVA